MSKGSDRAGSGLPIEADVAVVRPCLLPLSAEQQAEAVALLSELLLAAARRSANDRNVPTGGAEGSPSRWVRSRRARRRGLAA
jgi:hypothetical protein